MRSFDIKSLGQVVFESETTEHAEVAVVVPLYNYAPFVIECLTSVLDQTLDRLSIVVVDDCSTDEGPTLAVNFIRDNASRFCSARVIQHKRNQGPSMARNSGVAWSTEPLLFMLDADNRIRPPTLARLKSALETDGADFAYSQLFIFGIETEVGYADIWHADRLRYGNTIDVMALIRRHALINAGGYQVLGDDHGLEDYDLWCRFFTLGLRGVFVPELLCEYRRHGRSRQDTSANKNLETLVPQMALRYPEIFNSEARTLPIDQDFSISMPLDYEFKWTGKLPNIAVVVHVFYESMTDTILRYTRNIPLSVDIYISTDTSEKKQFIETRLLELSVRAEVRVTVPRGRDIAPRLLGFRDIYDNYDYVLLLHSKATLHDPEMKHWGKHLFENLLGSRTTVESIFELFNEVPNIGVVAAQHYGPVRKNIGWGENFDFCKMLAARFGVNLKSNGLLDYPSGSMLWARTAALRPFFDAKLAWEDFSPDHVGRQIDGTMAHAVERLFFVAAETAGYSWVKVARPDLFERRDTIVHITNPAELCSFVVRQKRILLGVPGGRETHLVAPVRLKSTA